MSKNKATEKQKAMAIKVARAMPRWYRAAERGESATLASLFRGGVCERRPAPSLVGGNFEYTLTPMAMHELTSVGIVLGPEGWKRVKEAETFTMEELKLLAEACDYYISYCPSEQELPAMSKLRDKCRNIRTQQLARSGK